MSVIGPIHKAATGHTLGAISQINDVQEGLVGKFEEVAFSIIGIILFGFTGRVELVHREVLELRVGHRHHHHRPVPVIMRNCIACISIVAAVEDWTEGEGKSKRDGT